MRINYSQWWDDMVAIMRANASILIAVAGAFILLPAIAANFFTTPFQPVADHRHHGGERRHSAVVSHAVSMVEP